MIAVGAVVLLSSLGGMHPAPNAVRGCPLSELGGSADAAAGEIQHLAVEAAVGWAELRSGTLTFKLRDLEHNSGADRGLALPDSYSSTTSAFAVSSDGEVFALTESAEGARVVKVQLTRRVVSSSRGSRADWGTVVATTSVDGDSLGGAEALVPVPGKCQQQFLVIHRSGEVSWLKVPLDGSRAHASRIRSNGALLTVPSGSRVYPALEETSDGSIWVDGPDGTPMVVGHQLMIVGPRGLDDVRAFLEVGEAQEPRVSMHYDDAAGHWVESVDKDE